MNSLRKFFQYKYLHVYLGDDRRSSHQRNIFSLSLIIIGTLVVLLLIQVLASTDVFTFKSNYWCLISYIYLSNMFCWYKTRTTMYLPIFSGLYTTTLERMPLIGMFIVLCVCFFFKFHYYCNYWILVIIKCMSFLGEHWTVRVIMRAWTTFTFYLNEICERRTLTFYN